LTPHLAKCLVSLSRQTGHTSDRSADRPGTLGPRNRSQSITCTSYLPPHPRRSRSRIRPPHSTAPRARSRSLVAAARQTRSSWASTSLASIIALLAAAAAAGCRWLLLLRLRLRFRSLLLALFLLLLGSERGRGSRVPRRARRYALDAREKLTSARSVAKAEFQRRQKWRGNIMWTRKC
jgi:hypothetical protein